MKSSPSPDPNGDALFFVHLILSAVTVVLSVGVALWALENWRPM